MTPNALPLRIGEIAVESFETGASRHLSNEINAATTEPCIIKQTLYTSKTCGGVTCGSTCGEYACA